MEYLTTEEIHGDKVIKDGNKVFKVSKWKGKRELKRCDTLVPIKGLKAMKTCLRPITHVVSWEIDRFYGKKHAESGFCEKHAKEWAEYLKNPKRRPDSKNDSVEPVKIRKL